MQNLVRAFRSTVRHNGPQPALLDASRAITWNEFGERVARAAGALRKLGIRSGARFAILSRNGFRHEELKWAGLWLGAVPVPINFRLAPPEIAQILADADCERVLVEAPFAPMLEHPALTAWQGKATPIGEAAGPNGALYEALLAGADPLPPHDAAADDDALLLYTGGTTGRGKGVRLSHANILASAYAFALGTGARRHHVYLHAAPMFHSADLLALGWLLQGAPQCYLPQFSPAAFLDAIERYQVGAVVTVPTMLIGVVSDRAAMENAALASLRVLIYGAAPMAVEWIKRVALAFPKVDLYNCYGLTETAPDLTVFDAREFRAALASDAPHLTSVGKSNVVNELKVVRRDGSECASDEAGELLARGPNIMQGYLNRPQETSAALRDGWLHTGDIARIDANGYVHLLDRLKDMVITGGENVYSAEVEAVLHRHPAIAEAAIIGVPDPTLGEAVMAVIVPRIGADPDPEQISAHCRASLGGFKVPRRFRFVQALPKSALGKVLKAELRRQYGTSEEADPARKEPGGKQVG
jgi:long-chain acyl-CoA synthetase